MLWVLYQYRHTNQCLKCVLSRCFLLLVVVVFHSHIAPSEHVCVHKLVIVIALMRCNKESISCNCVGRAAIRSSRFAHLRLIGAFRFEKNRNATITVITGKIKKSFYHVRGGINKSPLEGPTAAPAQPEATAAA